MKRYILALGITQEDTIHLAVSIVTVCIIILVMFSLMPAYPIDAAFLVGVAICVLLSIFVWEFRPRATSARTTTATLDIVPIYPMTEKLLQKIWQIEIDGKLYTCNWSYVPGLRNLNGDSVSGNRFVCRSHGCPDLQLSLDELHELKKTVKVALYAHIEVDFNNKAA